MTAHDRTRLIDLLEYVPTKVTPLSAQHCKSRRKRGQKFSQKQKRFGHDMRAARSDYVGSDKSYDKTFEHSRLFVLTDNLFKGAFGDAYYRRLSSHKRQIAI